jgi:hypothetical protein
MRYFHAGTRGNMQSWFHKPRFAIEGVIFRYDPDNDTITKIKSVPPKDLLINITGSWRGEIYFSRPNSKVLINVLAISWSRNVISSLISKHYPSSPRRHYLMRTNSRMNHEKYGKKSQISSMQKNGGKPQESSKELRASKGKTQLQGKSVMRNGCQSILSGKRWEEGQS